MTIYTRVISTYTQTRNGERISDEFYYRLFSWDKYLKGKLMQIANIEMYDDLSLTFTETPEQSFMVDIKADDFSKFFRVEELVRSAIPDVNFSFWHLDFSNGFQRLM